METITSRANPLAVHMKKLGAQRSYREQCGEILCDGIKLLEEAITSNIEITAVLTSSNTLPPLPKETRIYAAPRELIDSLSPLKNAQDTLFACKTPPPCSTTDMSGTHILLDNIQDPGNLGTIIRAANAFSIKSVIMTGTCADLWNPKTIRSSMGSVFKQRTHQLSISELEELRNDGIKLVGTATAEDKVPLVAALYRGQFAVDGYQLPVDGGLVAGENRKLTAESEQFSAASKGITKSIFDICLKNAIIAIGNEGRGLSEAVMSLCDETITIPISPNCESLNAATAAAIIMWEATRKQDGCNNALGVLTGSAGF